MKSKSKKIAVQYANALKEDASSLVKSTGGARFADYSDKDLLDLPENITENSFGCGNPLAFSAVKPGQTVLDLGCGAGLDLLIAAKAVGPEGKVIGVDMISDMLLKAQQHIDASGFRNIELIKGKIENLPIESVLSPGSIMSLIRWHQAFWKFYPRLLQISLVAEEV